MLYQMKYMSSKRDSTILLLYADEQFVWPLQCVASMKTSIFWKCAGSRLRMHACALQPSSRQIWKGGSGQRVYNDSKAVRGNLASSPLLHYDCWSQRLLSNDLCRSKHLLWLNHFFVAGHYELSLLTQEGHLM